MLEVLQSPLISMQCGVRLVSLLLQQLQSFTMQSLRLIQNDQLAVLLMFLQCFLCLSQMAVV